MTVCLAGQCGQWWIGSITQTDNLRHSCKEYRSVYHMSGIPIEKGPAPQLRGDSARRTKPALQGRLPYSIDGRGKCLQLHAANHLRK